MSFAAVILAGGKSLRMGENKAQLKIGRKSFTEMLADEFSDFDELLVSVGSSGVPVGYMTICDVFSNCGPMAGLHAALSAIRSDAALFVPCDVPLFTCELGKALCALLDDSTDAVVPKTRGLMHPLCAVYRKGAAAVFERHLKAGDYKIINAYPELRVKYTELDNTRFAAILDKNINTPEDYRVLCNEVLVISPFGTENQHR